MTNPEILDWFGQVGQVGQVGRVASPAGTPEGPEPVLPSADQAREQLRWLAVPEADIEPVIDTMPGPERTPELWRALSRCHAAIGSEIGADLGSNLGATRPAIPWPDAPAALGPAGRYFYVHVYLSVLPLTLAWHRQRGIPADVTHDTLADLGAKMATHRLVHGVGGLDKQSWLSRHFRGTIFRLGRLQFDRSVLKATVFDGDPGPGAPVPGGPAAGDPVLDIHIPGDGPLAPQLCDESFAAAREFFPRYFPEHRFGHAICRSWLLDDQLADHLPADANIVTFQRRFHLFPRVLEADHDVLEFVFHAGPDQADLAALPQDSTLRRAIVSHLRAGYHWHQRSGWMPL